MGLWGTIKKGAKWLGNKAKDASETVGGWLEDVWNATTGFLGSLWEDIWDAIKAGIGSFADFLGWVADKLGDFGGWLEEAVKQFWESIMDFIKDFPGNVEDVWNWLKDNIDYVLKWIADRAKTLWEKAKDAAKTVAEVVGDVIGYLTFWDTLSRFWDYVKPAEKGDVPWSPVVLDVLDFSPQSGGWNINCPHKMWVWDDVKKYNPTIKLKDDIPTGGRNLSIQIRQKKFLRDKTLGVFSAIFPVNSRTATYFQSNLQVDPKHEVPEETFETFWLVGTSKCKIRSNVAKSNSSEIRVYLKRHASRKSGPWHRIKCM